jgi:hypothetical protein
MKIKEYREHWIQVSRSFYEGTPIIIEGGISFSFRIYCHMMEWFIVIGFIEHLQIVTTSNYSAVTNSHTLQFTTVHTESSQPAISSPVVAW